MKWRKEFETRKIPERAISIPKCMKGTQKTESHETNMVCLDKAPRFSIRRVIWILLSDTETSAATPPGVIQKK